MKMLNVRFLILTAVLALSLTGSSLYGEIVVMDPDYTATGNDPSYTANDSNCPGNPNCLDLYPDARAKFYTIQDAIANATSCETIVVCPGFYEEHLDFLSKAVTITSTDPTDPTIVGQTVIDGSGSGDVVLLNKGEGSDSRLIGLTIQHGAIGIRIEDEATAPVIISCVITANTSHGIQVQDGSAVVDDCKIHENGQSGISISDGLLEISKSTITDNGDCGIYAPMSDIRVDRCTISDNTGAGIEKIVGDVSNGNIIGCVIISNNTGILNCSGSIRQCTISKNRDDGIHLNGSSRDSSVSNCLIAANQGDGVEGNNIPLDDFAIKNCTIVHNGGNGINESGYAKMPVSNCIISLNKGYGLSSVYSYPGLSSKYNNVHANFSGDYSYPWYEIKTENDMDVQPYFITPYSYENQDGNEVEEDYHLMSPVGRWDPIIADWVQDPIDCRSPCIDAGDPSESYGEEPDPNGGRLNLGVYGNTSEASKS